MIDWLLVQMRHGWLHHGLVAGLAFLFTAWLVWITLRARADARRRLDRFRRDQAAATRRKGDGQNTEHPHPP